MRINLSGVFNKYVLLFCCAVRPWDLQLEMCGWSSLKRLNVPADNLSTIILLFVIVLWPQAWTLKSQFWHCKIRFFGLDDSQNLMVFVFERDVFGVPRITVPSRGTVLCSYYLWLCKYEINLCEYLLVSKSISFNKAVCLNGTFDFLHVQNLWAR